MRSTRLLVGLLAVIVTAGLGLAVTTTSSGASGSDREPHKVFRIDLKNVGDSDKFKAAGRVKTHRNQTVVLQEAGDEQGPYMRFKTGKTNGRGEFRIVFFDPEPGTCYRILVPGTAQYRAFKGFLGCVVDD